MAVQLQSETDQTSKSEVSFTTKHITAAMIDIRTRAAKYGIIVSTNSTNIVTPTEELKLVGALESDYTKLLRISGVFDCQRWQLVRREIAEANRFEHIGGVAMTELAESKKVPEYIL